MPKYKGVCKLTNNEETIWFNMVSAKTLLDHQNAIVGLMNDCSVRKKFGIDMCKDCNLYKNLPQTNAK